MSVKLSLCLATFNEETNIHYPLDSAYDLVDEVIIVDGGSTDKTVEIAKKYGKKIKVFVEENPPMFHINKQKAIERAKGEWILQLDADEELSQELKTEIAKLLNGYIVNHPIIPSLKRRGERGGNNSTIQQFNNGFFAYYLPRKNFFLTRFLSKGGQYPDYTIRLYRNGYARFPCKDVHENVEIISNFKAQMSNQTKNPNTTYVIPAKAGIQKQKDNYIDSHLHGNDNLTMKQFNNKTIGYLKNPILHYADPDFSRYLKRWDRYTSLDAAILSKTIKQFNNLTIFVMFFDYFIIKPSYWFFLTYFRHLGFIDGFSGFVFALFSSIRFWVIYIKIWKLVNKVED